MKLIKPIYAFFAGLGVFGILAWFALCIGLAIGWFMNIYQVIMIALDPAAAFSVKLLVKLIGILVAPLGGIMGWL